MVEDQNMDANNYFIENTWETLTIIYSLNELFLRKF